MAWQDETETLLRYAINDVDSPQRYTNARLDQAMIVGANYVLQEYNFNNSYQLDFTAFTISPDPTINNNDPWLVNLSVMRSAIFMLNNDLKAAANSAWMIKDVDVITDLREMYKANKVIIDEMRKEYEHAGLKYQMGVRPSYAAILTPFNCLAGGFRSPMYGYDARDRMLY